MIPIRPERERSMSRINGASAAIQRAGEHYCLICGRWMARYTVDGLCNSYACWVRAGVIKEPYEMEGEQ